MHAPSTPPNVLGAARAGRVAPSRTFSRPLRPKRSAGLTQPPLTPRPSPLAPRPSPQPTAAQVHPHPTPTHTPHSASWACITSRRMSRPTRLQGRSGRRPRRRRRAPSKLVAPRSTPVAPRAPRTLRSASAAVGGECARGVAWWRGEMELLTVLLTCCSWPRMPLP